jgi:hypothetical protein
MPLDEARHHATVVRVGFGAATQLLLVGDGALRVETPSARVVGSISTAEVPS